MSELRTNVLHGQVLGHEMQPEHRREVSSAGRLPVFDRRRTGILLHLGSLDAALGHGGRAFIDWLVEGGFSVWQILPTGPTRSDRSPYFATSDFAGNPTFVDPEEQPDTESAEYAEFLNSARWWLEDYALFEVLSGLYPGTDWRSWPVDLRDRQPTALRRVANSFAAELEGVKRGQFAFFAQWRRLREYAHSRGVRLFGDMPFYLGVHSAETWANRTEFDLDAEGRAAAVSGLPPDCYSSVGQVWGHPLYDWTAMRRNRFAYWRARVSAQLRRVDLLRIDHFQAFAAHWAVPAGTSDASRGQWRQTPGFDLLRVLREEFGELPLATEDLGYFTKEAVVLRKLFGLPGMRVLQFAYDGSRSNPHLPAHHQADDIVYTATHDNDTTMGWYRKLDSRTRRRINRLRTLTGPLPETLIHEAISSVGRLAIIPMQDILGLGSEARLNTPGTVFGDNWRWRLSAYDLTAERARSWHAINKQYGRICATDARTEGGCTASSPQC